MLYLNQTLARNSAADPDDTLKVKKKLNQWGYMEAPSYGLDDMPDEPLFKGIKNFQQDKGLKVDGVMKPGGETEKAMNDNEPVKRAGFEKPEIKPITESKDQNFQPPEVNPKIEKPVGIGKANNPKDVKLIWDLLEKGGYLLKPSHASSSEKSTATPDFKFAIQAYQKDNNLKMDGQVNPGGETETSLQNRHPGLPGDDLPVVMPGPQQPEPDDMSSLCEGLFTQIEAKKFKIEGWEKDIKEWAEAAGRTAADAQAEFNEDDLLAALGLFETGLVGLAALTGSALAASAASVVGILLAPVGAIKGLEWAYNEIYTYQERIEDTKLLIQSEEKAIAKLEKEAVNNNCSVE